MAETTRRAAVTAKLSHDLRTPLANLALYVDLIARRGDEPAVVRRYRDVIAAEIGRLCLLADNVVIHGRSATPEPLRLGDAIPDLSLAGTLTRLEPLFAAAACDITVDHGAPERCRFDRMGFERVVINLLDNARKFAPGPIRIGTRQTSGWLRLEVRDFGAGHDGGSGDGAAEGFGLGLAVVRDLAGANGGTVTVEDAAPGTRVIVTMRTQAADAPL